LSVYSNREFLTPEECQQAISLFPPPAPALTEIGDAIVAHRTIRTGRSSFLSPTNANFLTAKLEAAVQRANNLLWQFEIIGFEPFQLAEYREGDGYDWHLDIGPSASTRKVSLTVQLSDPADYDDGDLEIFGQAPADRACGSATIFPGYLLHRVTLVTRGIRYALVA